MKKFFIFVAIVAGFLIGIFSHRYTTQTILLRGHGNAVIAVILRTDSLSGKVLWTYVGEDYATGEAVGWEWPESWVGEIQPHKKFIPPKPNEIISNAPKTTFSPDEVSPPKTPDFKTLHPETNAVDQR